jgi:hypothetical protein
MFKIDLSWDLEVVEEKKKSLGPHYFFCSDFETLAKSEPLV